MFISPMLTQAAPCAMRSMIASAWTPPSWAWQSFCLNYVQNTVDTVPGSEAPMSLSLRFVSMKSPIIHFLLVEVGATLINMDSYLDPLTGMTSSSRGSGWRRLRWSSTALCNSRIRFAEGSSVSIIPARRSAGRDSVLNVYGKIGN